MRARARARSSVWVCTRRTYLIICPFFRFLSNLLFGFEKKIKGRRRREWRLAVGLVSIEPTGGACEFPVDVAIKVFSSGGGYC